jgi:hypothetical protein
VKAYSSTAHEVHWFSGFKLITISLVLSFCAIFVVPPAWSQETAPPTSEGGNTSSAGMQAAAGFSTLLYLPFKAAFAICGGVVGGLAYAFSGGNEKAAQSIWTTTMYGTYILTPDHLNGNRPIRFLGVADTEESAQETPPPMEPIR